MSAGHESYQEVLDDAAVTYADSIRKATTPAEHLAAAQAVGNNVDIYPTDQGLVITAGLSMVVKSLTEDTHG